MGPACSGRNADLRNTNSMRVGDPVDPNDTDKTVWGVDVTPGANSISVETPERISQGLGELNQHLRGMLSFGDTALRQAYQQNPSYIDDDKFRLAFLRADRFDAKKASCRMMKHFDMKRKLFGSHLLGRDVRQSDLSDDDLECLHSGFMQISPYKDRHGRTVGFNTMKLVKFRSLQNVVRPNYYGIPYGCAYLHGYICVFFILSPVDYVILLPYCYASCINSIG
jgi:hypothetical protein